MAETYATVERERNRLRNRVYELEEALFRYSRHGIECRLHRCVCGLDDILEPAIARLAFPTSKGVE